MCDARLADAPHGLACTNTAPHTEHHGCTYESTSGVAGSQKEE